MNPNKKITNRKAQSIRRRWEKVPSVSPRCQSEPVASNQCRSPCWFSATLSAGDFFLSLSSTGWCWLLPGRNSLGQPCCPGLRRSEIHFRWGDVCLQCFPKSHAGMSLSWAWRPGMLAGPAWLPGRSVWGPSLMLRLGSVSGAPSIWLFSILSQGPAAFWEPAGWK